VLTSYLTSTRRLLQLPPATTALYLDSDLTAFINTARGQMAGETNCIRVFGTLALINPTIVYPFSSINISGVSGAGSVIHIRQVWVQVAGGSVPLRVRSFPWFGQFHLNEVVPTTGQPQVWSQYAQGANGSVYVWPVPDMGYTLNLDTVCLPVALADDTTIEAIPQLWQDAVPYFAAYYAYLSAQRSADADRMYKIYEEFIGRARNSATPEVLPHAYVQTPDQTLQNKLGIQPSRGGGGG